MTAWRVFDEGQIGLIRADQLVRFFAVGLSAFLLAACVATSTGAPSGLAGQRLEAQQTLSAIDRQLAAATEAAGATQAAHAFSVTTTADSLQAAQAQSAATATAGAQALVATQTAQAVTFNLRATESAATATRAAQGLQATQQAAQVTRSERASDLYASLGPLAALAVFIGLLAALVLFFRAGWDWLDSLNRRRALVETRAGTVLLIGTPGGLLANVIARPALPPMSDTGDEWASEAPTADGIPSYQRGKLRTVLERVADDPDRALALRLLRAAMLAAGPDSPHLPGFRELGWPAETWTKAVALLKPHVITAPGRGGGTFATEGTLRDLYNAVGERRIRPGAALPQVESVNEPQNVR